jgi:hypothetical protein
MGYVKEPEGVDFIIKSDPLTDEDRKKISAFIAEYKAKNAPQKSSQTSLKKKKGATHHVVE